MKEKALEKMLQEMNQSHSSAEDSIHNFLCEQDDEKLFEGILKEGKSIKQAMFYCIEQARKVEEGNAAMVDDNTVFDWVKDYFLGNKTIINKTVQAEMKATSVHVPISAKSKPTKHIKKKETVIDDIQLSLF